MPTPLKILVVFLFGVAVAVLGMHTLGGDGQPKVITKSIIVPDTKTVTRVAPAPASAECKTYMHEVNKMRDAQELLSKSSGELDRVMDDIQTNIYTKDPLKAKELQDELNLVNARMSAAWNAVGDAKAYLDQFLSGQEPCQ